jgi:hypothetical protein
MCIQVGGTRGVISISCQSFSFPPTSAHVFKIRTLVFKVVTLAKKEKGNHLLGFCYTLHETFGVCFYDYKGLIP